jgi:amino acid efflux transporter
VCLIGATYVSRLAGGGTVASCSVAALLLLAVLALASGGMRATTTVQLVLVCLLIAVIVAAVVGAAPGARAGNWAPFAPHGWGSVGSAASTLMFSFVGWEAVAPLTGRFRDPARQLPRVIGTALAVTTAIYLALAVTTIAVLGRGAATDVPLAALLARAAGGDGSVIAAIVAVVLTLGTTNAYLTGAFTMARDLARSPARSRSGRPFRALIAMAGAALLGLYGAGLVTTTQLVSLPTALFLTAYLGCTLSGTRTLRGAGRGGATAALVAVIVLLAFCGWALAFAAVVTGTALLTSGRHLRPNRRT